MSVSGPKRHRFILALAVISTAVIAACDGGPTQPKDLATRVNVPRSNIEGDSSSCVRGWTVQQGLFVCNP